MKSKNYLWTLLVSVWCLLMSETKGLDFATHIGCFKSNLKEFKYRFVSNSGLVLRGKITPEVCVNHCKDNSFRYAGLHSSFNCLCSNSRPQLDVSSGISVSYYRCDGNRNERCTGPNKVNVYEIYDKSSNETDPNYIGCFLDGGTRERIFATKMAIKQKFVTPQACIEFCYRKEYKYAGITYRFLCSCDNQLGTKKNEKLCNKYSGNASFIGVGKMYMRIYNTKLSS